MSDWKSRATPVTESPSSDWKSRAQPVTDDTEPSSLTQNLGDVAKGIGQGATLGFGDELLGAGQAVKDVATDPNKKLADLAALYRQHQQENQSDWEAAKERSPVLTTGGEFAGGAFLSGPLGLATKGLSKLQMAARMGAAGAAAGLGGSKGTIEDSPGELAKDALTGGVVGGVVAPAIGAGIGKGISKLGQMVEDSPLLKKLGYTWDAVKNRGQSFTGAKAGEDIRNDVNTASQSITKQLLQPLGESSDLFGQEIADATGRGVKLNQNEETLKALDSVKRLLQQKPGGRDSRDALDILNQHGSQSLDPETLQTITNSIDPRQAKDLQLILRKLRGSPVYQGEGVIYDAEDALRSGLDEMLPEAAHTNINKTFSNARSVVEPLLNKGNIAPELQPKSVSDIDSDQLGSKVNDYVKKLIKSGQDSNELGVESKGTMNDLLSNARNINEKAQTQFVDPGQISKQFEDASMKHAVRKGIYGDRASDTLAKPGIMDFVTGSPYRAMEGAAKVARGVEQSQIAQSGKNFYHTSDDNLRSLVDKLNQSGLGHMGQALQTALDNKATAAKNAALFSIMQNPKSRQLLGMDEEDKK